MTVYSKTNVDMVEDCQHYFGTEMPSRLIKKKSLTSLCHGQLC